MLTAPLPDALRLAIDRLAHTVEGDVLTRAGGRLSARYRSHSAAQAISSRADAVAYAVSRMPATYAGLASVFDEVRRLHPQWQPGSLLDLGAGTGAGWWAAAATFPALTGAVAIEPNRWMTEVGRELISLGQTTTPPALSWLAQDLSTCSLEPAELVVMSYVLGELTPAHRPLALHRAWTATTGVIVVVEPGTPAGFAAIARARTDLVSAGAHIVAPCPHADACPMHEDDWCHFAVRLPRARTHRLAKGGELAFEDEKFSYVAVARTPVASAAARILRHPHHAPDRITLQLCAPRGLVTETVGRGDPSRFRRARKADWGEAFPVR